jgi:S-adenosylmethionine decarboxylase
MKHLGKHLIVEFHDCDPDVLNDTALCEQHLLHAANLAGTTVIRPFFHHFSPHGVSGIIVIAESHFSIHTWPEYGYVALDIFTCGDQVQAEPALDYLREQFAAKHYSLVEMKRGLLDLPGQDVKYKPETEAT